MPTPTPTPGGTLPNFSHVFVIVMENEESSAIVGNGAAPYVNGLLSDHGLAARYYAAATRAFRTTSPSPLAARLG